VAFIIGAARGQGRAEPLRLAAEGAHRIRDRGDVARRHGGWLEMTPPVLRRHRLSTAGFKVMNPPPSPRALHLPHRREFNRDD
jgi:NAD(P)-dependent dehydrogenase (short-subunit alcohol dehydrogenase family)